MTREFFSYFNFKTYSYARRKLPYTLDFRQVVRTTDVNARRNFPINKGVCRVQLPSWILLLFTKYLEPPNSLPTHCQYFTTNNPLRIINPLLTNK